MGCGTPYLGSSIARTQVPFSSGTIGPDDHSGAYSYRFTSACLPSQGFVPASVLHAQHWSCDPSAPSALQFSDAVRFSVLP